MKIVVVRVKGTIGLSGDKKDTLRMLNLNKPNHAVVLELTPQVQGMLDKVHSILTWGPVSEKNITELKKHGEKIFRLNPPRKGYGRKGVKMPFKFGGALGDRKEKMNDLVERML